MPAQVRAVQSATGDMVEKGQTLLLLGVVCKLEGRVGQRTWVPWTELEGAGLPAAMRALGAIGDPAGHEIGAVLGLSVIHNMFHFSRRAVLSAQARF